MVVPIYSDGRERFTFLKLGQRRPRLRVEVPEGSEVLGVNGLGPQLFVPTAPMMRRGFDVVEVIKAARAGRPGFRFV